jgi:hypothetical protein
MTPKTIASIVGVGVLVLAGLGTAQPDKPKKDKPEKPEKPALAERMRGPGPGPGPSASGSARPHRMHGHGDWADEFRKRRPTPKEVQERMAEIRSTVAARRAERVAEMRARFGPMAFGHREFAEEFRRHARRMAFLNRAKFIATTELEDPKRSTALARIDKLLAREKERHERRVEKLKSNVPTPGPSGSASAAPVPTTSAAPAPSGSSSK